METYITKPMLNDSYHMIGKIESAPDKDILPENNFEATLFLTNRIDSPIYKSNDNSHIYALYDDFYLYYELS